MRADPAPSLRTMIQAHLQQEGAIRLDHYMDLCLTHPQGGYYATRDPFQSAAPKGGDFITAPEISQIFGELIGAWFINLWQRLGAPPRFHMIECGPGRGTLMSDFLRIAPPAFRDALHLHVVEINPVLRATQSQILAAYHPCFHTQVADALRACDDAPVFVLGNEFLDVFPIRQFQKTDQGWREAVIVQSPMGPLKRVYQGVVEDAAQQILPPHAPLGAIWEYAPGAQEAIALIAGSLATRQGYALFIDYGAAQPGYGDTFQAVGHHAYQDPLETPGALDLTAHVNFPDLMRVAQEAGASTYGPVLQGDLLRAWGLEPRVRYLCQQALPAQQLQIQTGAHRLAHPQHMGALFKAIALSHPTAPLPEGFPCSTPLPCAM